jgi:hypothetical protein
VNNLWSQAGNWNDGVAPVSGDSLLFPMGGLNTTNINDIAGLTLQSVSLESSYVVSGNAIVLVGGVTVVAGVSGPPTVGWYLPTMLGASQTFQDQGVTTFGSSIDLNGHTLTIVPYVTTVAGSITGTGGVVLAAGGGLNLTGTSTFTGTFTLAPMAKMNVAGSISNSTLVVGNGARLSGDGSVPATSLIASTLSVGNDSGAGCCPDPQTTGILSTGNLSIQGGTVRFDLRSTTPGTGYDQIHTTGTVTLADPTLEVVLPSGLPAPGQSFTIVDNDGTDPIAGTFSGLPEGTAFAAGGAFFRITYLGGTGNDIVLTVLAGPPPRFRRSTAWHSDCSDSCSR